MRTAPKTALFITAIALAVGLSGCSGSGQSVADACKLITEEGTEISSKAQELASSAATDPEAATEALEDVQKEFEALAEKVTNDEVKPVFGEFVSAYGEFSAIIGEVSADPDKASEAMEKMTDTTAKVGEAGDKLSKICAG